MGSKRSHEGYLLVDNRNSPGVSDELAVRAGFPVGAGRGVFEAPTITCSHCQRIVVLNPLRNRERAYCSKCDHYICDTCGVVKAQTGECRTMKQVLEEAQERAARAEQSGALIIIP